MSLAQHLDDSNAAASFRDAVTTFLQTGRPSERLSFGRGAPPVKVERTLSKVLLEYPTLEIESIDIQASSGCEYFRGELILRTADGERRVRFDWDCRWRAEQNGWRDYFGFPDQARAAREYGWDCFRSWDEIVAVASSSPALLLDA